MTFIFKNFDLRAATLWSLHLGARMAVNDASLQIGMWKLCGTNYVCHIFYVLLTLHPCIIS